VQNKCKTGKVGYCGAGEKLSSIRRTNTIRDDVKLSSYGSRYKYCKILTQKETYVEMTQ